MFPYLSGMMYLLGMNQSPGSNVTMRSPWDQTLDNPDGTDSADNYAMQPWKLPSSTSSTVFHGTGSGSPITIDPNARRHALGAGLTALGSSLLANSATGNWARGLGEGAQGFSQAFGGEMDKARAEAVQNWQIQHQQTADERAADEARDRHRASDQEYTINEAKLSSAQQKAKDDAESAAATSAAARKMVSNIKAVAQANPADPKLQAMASEVDAFDLGDSSDLNKLAVLHQQLLGQAFHAQDTKQATDDLIAGKKAEIGAGVASNPVTQEADRQRELAISAGHLKVAQDALAQRGRTGSSEMSDKDYEKLLQRKITEKVATKVKAWKSLRPPTPYDMKKMRDDAAVEAAAEITAGKDALDDIGLPDFSDVGGGAGSTATVRKRFDPKTGTFQVIR